MNKGYSDNSTKWININRKKKQKRDLNILRVNREREGRREKEEEEEKGGKLEGKQKGVEENKFKGKIQVFKCINVC